jgi:hypothetical protein
MASALNTLAALMNPDVALRAVYDRVREFRNVTETGGARSFQKVDRFLIRFRLSPLKIFFKL